MNPPAPLPTRVDAAAIFAIERPHPKLWTYYLLCALATGPLFLLVVLPSWFRYRTMRYRFDAEGISMRWGILFRREVLLNYARIQDIHLVSNFVERWLGLARIQIQTASGSATPEMTIEGLTEFEVIRDFLYERMRGTIDRQARTPQTLAAVAVAPPGSAEDLPAVAATLHEVAGELRKIREHLASRRTP